MGLSVGINVGAGPPLWRSMLVGRVGGWVGIDTLWMVDHYTGWFPQELWNPDLTWLAKEDASVDAFYDWQVMAGYLAARRPRQRIGIGVTEALRRHPVTLAQAALTMSHLSPRSFILGLGSGEAENTIPYGVVFDRPVSRLEEALQVIRLCFVSQGAVDFEGRFYRLDRAILDLAPGRGGQPEIWIAAHGPRMLELTGRYGDGWYPAIPMTPDDYADRLATIRVVASEEGRDPDGITAAMLVPYLSAPDHRTAEKWLGHRAVRFLALLASDRTWAEVGAEHPLGKGFGGLVDFIPSHLDPTRIDRAIDQVPVELLSKVLIWGSVEEVVGQIKALSRAGLQHVVLAPVAPLVSRRALAHTMRSLPGIIRWLTAD